MENIWITLLTTVVPSILAIIAVVFNYFKNKAEIDKIKADTGAVGGDIFLKWTKEFKARLEWVEDINKKHAEKIEEQDKIISSQSILITEHVSRIHALEVENSEFKKIVEELKVENGQLRLRVSELEIENKSLRDSRLLNGTNN